MKLEVMSCLAVGLSLVSISSTSRLPDWLISDITWPTTLTNTTQGTLLLSNGLVAREFALRPDFGTVDLYSFAEKSSALRAINPEAIVSLGESCVLSGNSFTGLTF